VDVDRYGRTVALVAVGTRLVNQELVWQGLAWVFTRYCYRPICEEWTKLEAEARKAGPLVDAESRTAAGV
jgi:micrococcal nuclease